MLGAGMAPRGPVKGAAPCWCPLTTAGLLPFLVQRKQLAALRAQWRGAILQALQKAKHNMSQKRTMSGYNSLYPYLCLLPDEEYVDIMMQVGACPDPAETREWGLLGLPQGSDVPVRAAESEHESQGLPRLLDVGPVCSLC